MPQMDIFMAIAIVTGLGFFAAVILVFASKVMAVEEDPRITEVNEILPGANCGACGYAGCADYARAIIEDDVDITLCKPGRDKVINEIKEYLAASA